MKKGYDVFGADNLCRRMQVSEVGSKSLTPILPIAQRVKLAEDCFGGKLFFRKGDIHNSKFVYELFKDIRPDTIIHLAQMPSAPYSMIDLEHANKTIYQNTIGCNNVLWGMRDIVPEAHLIKMGTMGEYGTPNIDIPEGFFEIEYRGRKDKLPFPKQAGSIYHWTKVFDSQLAMFASKIWGIKATDMNQGIVYGVSTDENMVEQGLISRFDYDGVFGTILNRFVVQSIIGMPLSVFGKGGQIRGFINIKDVLQCIGLYIKNPPKDENYCVFNQLAEVGFTMTELAEKIVQLGLEKGYKASIRKIDNPRVESEEHYYNPDHKKLLDLGFKPANFDKEIARMFDDLSPYKDLINKEVIEARVKWNHKR